MTIKKHMFTVSLHFMHYNFARVHKSLNITSAMQAGIDDHLCSINEIVMLILSSEAKKRGNYKMRAEKLSN